VAINSNRRWVVAGCQFGTIMGLFSGVYAYHDGAHLARAVAGGFVAAVVGGLFFGFALRRLMGSALSVGAELPAPERKRAWQAALRGPAPAEPEVHLVAAQMARRHLAMASGARFVLMLILFVVLTSTSLWLAITTERWWQWVLATFFLIMIGMQVWDRRRWRQRVAVLVDDPTTRA